MSASLLLALALTSMLRAKDEPARAPDEPVQMPVVKVPATRLERYTVVQWTGAEGHYRLILKPGPDRHDMLAILVGGAFPGDEIISIDGKPVAAMARNKWSRELYGNFKLVIKRPVGRRSYRLLEVDGRRDT